MKLNNTQKKYFSTGLLSLGAILIVVAFFLLVSLFLPNSHRWSFQSIDTMKFSRDLAREKINDRSFDSVIDRQVKEIASTGATHIAIATPYDKEFYPYLSRWVKTARKYSLKVWFRGNFSGWEGWFDYPKITRGEHLTLTKAFILQNKDLFEDGDAFTACPECENGGPGDPRVNGDVAGHRNFLIEEYNAENNAFKSIGKKVTTSLNSMNMDVAKLIMDKNTTKKLGGIVTVDHYVKTPEQFKKDINFIKAQSGGNVVIGEFGAPIPDITGDMTEKEQNSWILSVLNNLALDQGVVGVNYWVGEGGSTQLWNNGTARMAVTSISKFYKSKKMLMPF